LKVTAVFYMDTIDDLLKLVGELWRWATVERGYIIQLKAEAGYWDVSAREEEAEERVPAE